MKRFITLSAAVLIGLVSAQTAEPTPAPQVDPTPQPAPTPTPQADPVPAPAPLDDEATKQSNFALRNAALKVDWDQTLDLANTGSCVITADSNTFYL
jgi:hypothetical protein